MQGALGELDGCVGGPARPQGVQHHEVVDRAAEPDLGNRDAGLTQLGRVRLTAVAASGSRNGLISVIAISFNPLLAGSPADGTDVRWRVWRHQQGVVSMFTLLT